MVLASYPVNPGYPSGMANASQDTVSPGATPDPLSDPGYRAAVVDLVAVLAYGELSAFERLCDDSALAPTLSDKAQIAEMACAEFGHFQLLRGRLSDLGVNPDEAMQPFIATFDAFHASTAPADWLEGLVKAYVGDSIAADFYREIATFLDDSTRELVLEVFQDTGHSDFVVAKVRAAIEADPRVGGRLALWGRRLMGEALSQAQRVAAERDALSGLLTGTEGAPGVDLVELGKMFTRLTESHTRRMATLGLAA